MYSIGSKINLNKDFHSRNTKLYSKNLEEMLNIILCPAVRKSICSICLKKSSPLRDMKNTFEIINSSFSCRKALDNIFQEIFGSGNSLEDIERKICEKCTEQLLRTYIFIEQYKTKMLMLKFCVQKLVDTSFKTKFQDSLGKLVCNIFSNNEVPPSENQCNNKKENEVLIKEENRSVEILKIEINRSKHKSETYSYQCSMCSEDFNRREHLEAHKLAHPNDTSHICRIDGKMFDSYKDFKRHKSNHMIKNKDVNCAFCNKKFSSKICLKRHMQSHLTNKVKCVECGREFSSKNLLKSHEKRIHKENFPCHMCEVCGKTCKSVELLRAHSNSHKTKECQYCHKILKTHAHFHLHIKQHRLGKDRKTKYRTTYKCDHCVYISLNKKTLEAHINKVHLNVRPFVCVMCGKGFFRESNLIEHGVVHTKQKSVTCEICGDSFVNKRCLREHLRLHSGERPYPCNMCDEKFVSSGRRLDHVKRKHLEKSEKCDICNRKFSLKKELNRHVKKVHFKEKRAVSVVNNSDL